VQSINNIFSSKKLTFEQIKNLLLSEGNERQLLFRKAAEVKEKYVGKVVYFRGLIELSNICGKNCYYCGIRSDNKNVERYNLTDAEVLSAVEYAYKNKFASVVIQAGEIVGEAFTTRIEHLLYEIKKHTNNEIGVTLSLGEQSRDTFQRWKAAGAHRYLLRIESSNPELYEKIHPRDEKHSFKTRLNCLKILKELGYQLGTGVMIGLPFQTIDDLANDLIFMREFDIDMCGMGPYIEHRDTPLFDQSSNLMSVNLRFDLTLKMIAVLRIMMKDINIAATTALQAIDPIGREKAIKVGANIIMPNITPGIYRNNYKLYENKPCTEENADDCSSCLEARIAITGNEIGYGKWGDSKHFEAKKM
jgi:biotin synthase